MWFRYSGDSFFDISSLMAPAVVITVLIIDMPTFSHVAFVGRHYRFQRHVQVVIHFRRKVGEIAIPLLQARDGGAIDLRPDV